MSSEPMVGNFVKLYGSIVTSSVWSESAPTRIVWLTMLAIADANGGVAGSVPGLARIANVTLAECEAALKVLSEPDAYSRTTDHDGRRITAVPGGWTVLNYKLYREMRTAKQVADAERQARHRAVGQSVTVTEVTTEEEGEEEVRGQRTTTTPPPPSLADGLVPEVARLALRQVLGTAKNPTKAAHEIKAYADGLRHPLLPTPGQLGRAVLDFAANGPEWNSGYFRSYVKRAIAEDAPKLPRATKPRLSKQEIGRQHLAAAVARRAAERAVTEEPTNGV